MSMNLKKLAVFIALLAICGVSVAEVNSGTGSPQSTESLPDMMAWLLSWWPW